MYYLYHRIPRIVLPITSIYQLFSGWVLIIVWLKYSVLQLGKYLNQFPMVQMSHQKTPNRTYPIFELGFSSLLTIGHGKNINYRITCYVIRHLRYFLVPRNLDKMCDKVKVLLLYSIHRSWCNYTSYILNWRINNLNSGAKHLPST